MNKEEMICKNCKYHYIEEISFDYPQSCCDKRKAVIEEWFKCNDFEYSDKYIKQLQQVNKILKENAEHNDKVVDKVNWENMLLKKENKQLKDNWNKLREYIGAEWYSYDNESVECEVAGDILDKMQELQGNDSDE